MSDFPQLQEDLNLVKNACQEAGEIALGYFGASQANDVWYKGGESPVSEADMAVNDHLLSQLQKIRPGYGWLSEETREDETDKSRRQAAEFTFVVDPIDGTRGFINNADEWCISVAVVSAGKPVIGVLHCPVLNKTYWATKGGGAFLNGEEIASRANDAMPDQPIVTGSRKLIETLSEIASEHYNIRQFVPSLAYRLAMVAEGEIDVAFARGGAKDWDIAAAHLILTESGCAFSNLEMQVPLYNQPTTRVGALVASPQPLHQSILEIAKQLGFLQ